jgi:exosome complex RNA-binding protein Csl4
MLLLVMSLTLYCEGFLKCTDIVRCYVFKEGQNYVTFATQYFGMIYAMMSGIHVHVIC